MYREGVELHLIQPYCLQPQMERVPVNGYGRRPALVGSAVASALASLHASSPLKLQSLSIPTNISLPAQAPLVPYYDITKDPQTSKHRQTPVTRPARWSWRVHATLHAASDLDLK